MAIYMDLSAPHSVVSANFHYYRTPTQQRYIDRTLQYHDLIYILEGDWAFTEDDQDYQLQQGDVLLLCAGRHHYTRRPCKAGTRTFCIHISCSETDRAGAPEVVELPTLLHMAGEQAVMHYFQQIVQVQWSDQPYKQERLDCLLRLLLLELTVIQQKRSKPQLTLADRAISLITENPHRRITAQEAAEMLFVSEKTLSNAMRRKTGMGFYAYARNLRLDMIAAQLITEGDLRIGEIADAFGFHDEFHLSNAFKKKFGMSPQKYRQLHTENTG